MKTITLQEIITWLLEKPGQEVICWDTFEPRHGLLVRYFQEQGYTGVSSEYDRAMIDTKGKKATILARYDQDLVHFNYALHYTSLRYRPTAGALLAYSASEAWHEQPEAIPQWMLSVEDFNALNDRADRPADLPWRHQEIITVLGHDTLMDITVFPANVGGPDRIHPEYGAARHVQMVVNASREEIPFVYCQLQPAPPHYPGVTSCEYHFDYGGWHRAAANLYEGNTITLTTTQHTLIGTWQRQGERLVLLEQKG